MIARMEPMTAATVDREDELSLFKDSNWIAEEKFNGARYMLHLEDEGNKLYSRSLSTKAETKDQPIDKAKNVPHITGRIYPELNGTVLDGEITATKTGFNHASSVMNSLAPKAIEKQKTIGLMHYNVFDIMFYKGKDIMNLSLTQRREYLKLVIDALKIPEVIMVQQITSNKEDFYNQTVDAGGEGVVLKHTRSFYVPGDRNKTIWVKVKKTKTWDVVIMGYTEPEKESTNVKGEITINKNYAKGWIRAVVTGVFENGQLIEVGHTSGFDDATRKLLSENKDKYLGQVIEVKGQEILERAIINPRFICFRPDLVPSTCTLQKLLSQK